MSNPEEVGKTFATAYYQQFDTNRGAIAPLYTQQSTLCFEGQTYQGQQAIQQKFTELPFQTIQHAITTLDCQMTVDGGLLVCVVGQLKTDNDPPHSFSHTFYLKQIGDSLFILNEIFRLSLHNIAA